MFYLLKYQLEGGGGSTEIFAMWTPDSMEKFQGGAAVKILVSKGILPCPPLSPRRNTCHGLVYVTVAFFNQF